MGYIQQKLLNILDNNYGIYFRKYGLKVVGCIWQNYGVYWSIGYIKHKLRDILAKTGIN